MRYALDDAGIERLNADFVMKAAELGAWFGNDSQEQIANYNHYG